MSRPRRVSGQRAPNERAPKRRAPNERAPTKRAPNKRALDRLYDAMDPGVEWFVEQSTIVQYVTVFLGFVVTLSVGASSSWLLTIFLPRLLFDIGTPPQPQVFTVASEGLDPVTGVPLIPQVADPFIQRIAYAMPYHMFDWIYQTPCNMNPNGYGLDELDGGAKAFLRLRRALSPDLKDRWEDAEDKVREADTETKAAREGMLQRLGFEAFCQGDEKAKMALEAERSAEAEETQALEKVKDEASWGWRRCVRTAVGGLFSELGGLPEEPGRPISEACSRVQDQEQWSNMKARLRDVRDAAVKEQHRVLDQVRVIAQTETDDVLHELILPAVRNCTTGWTPVASRNRCLDHILPSLDAHSIAGRWVRPSWANGSDDSGRGHTVMVREPDVVYGIQIPSEKPSSHRRRWDPPSRKQDVTGLQHDFLNSIIAEMLARSALDVLGSFEDTCDAEETRARTWWAPSSPGHPDRRPPQQPGIFGLFTRALDHLSHVPLPFRSPRVSDGEEATSTAFQFNLPFKEKPARNERGKPTNRERFFNAAVQRSTCLYTAERSGHPTTRLADADADAVAVPAHLLVGLPRGNVAAAERVFRTAAVEVTGSIWGFWHTGPEVQWIMVWNHRFGYPRGDFRSSRYALDLGGEVEILKTRACKRVVGAEEGGQRW